MTEEVAVVDGADASPAPQEVDVNDLAAVEAASKADAPAEEGLESEAESPPADEKDVEEKTGDSFQERIDELTGKWRQTQRELQTREQELQTREQELEEMRRQLDEVKTLADFEYDEGKYQQYVFDEARKQAREAARLEARSVGQEREQQRLESDYKRRESEFSGKVKDYHAVVYDQNLRISQPMAEAIRTMDDGPEIAYWLGKNPDKASDISRESAVRVGIEFSKIQAKIATEKAKAKEKVSEAPPPPPKKIGGAEPGKRIETTSPDSDKLSDDEWFKREAARQAKMRG